MGSRKHGKSGWSHGNKGTRAVSDDQNRERDAWQRMRRRAAAGRWAETIGELFGKGRRGR
jgi:hypothetical protein